MMELDLAYVETKSLFLDLKILASTPIAVLMQAWDLQAGRKAAAKAPPTQIVAPALPRRAPPGKVPGPLSGRTIQNDTNFKISHKSNGKCADN